MNQQPNPSPALRLRTGLAAGSLTVYGSDGCSWTKKQIDYLDQKGIPYRYVNCSEGQCPGFVQGYPTLAQNGKILVGFHEV
jgi:hypothetical protein